MDAVSYINQNKDVLSLLNHLNTKGIREDNNFIRSCCPIHNGDNPSAFVINIESGLWFCHTGGCGGGDIFTLVQKVRNIGFKEAIKELADLFGLDIDQLEVVKRQSSYIKDIQSFITTMKRQAKIKQKEIIVDVPMKSFKELRGFKKETLDHFGVKYVESINLINRQGEEYTFTKRMYFPIIIKNKLIGFSLRATNKEQKPKWSHQPQSFATKNVLYNYDAINTSNIITVVEGMFDVMACYEAGIENSVCTFGAHITDMQYKLILKTGKDICLMFDNDDAGKAATDKALSMFKNKANIYLVDMPVGKDPESITRQELMTLYEQKRRHTSY